MVITLCLAGVSALVAWNCAVIFRHEKELVAISNSRFTATDGLTVWKELANIRETIAKLPKDFPPPDYVKMTEQRFNGIESRVAKMEISIDSLTTTLNNNRVDIMAIRNAVEKNNKP